MFDVIEHLADDLAALRQAHNLLSANGKLLLTVPAHMNLWSYSDKFAGHYRRYEYNDLAERLQSAGFTIDYLTQFMAATLPAMWIRRKLSVRNQGKGDSKDSRQLFLRDLRPMPVVNGMLRWILEREASLVRSGFTIPFGTSLLAIASKPKKTLQ
jgi:hypothetical protein